MLTIDAMQALLTALAAAGIDAHDGEPVTPTEGRYVAAWDDTGLRRPARHGGNAPNATYTYRLMCVARTPDGLRALVDDVTAALTGLRLGGRETSPLTEQFAGPALTGGPDGDKRHTKTLTYTAAFPRPRPAQEAPHV